MLHVARLKGLVFVFWVGGGFVLSNAALREFYLCDHSSIIYIILLPVMEHLF